jgi:hypothetical protein
MGDDTLIRPFATATFFWGISTFQSLVEKENIIHNIQYT